ncbi:MAG: hypothetical protein HQM13_11685 [SAR324 cluster bacterium]|nr:hypothetical protein [SAR324 cluster bacterium]
MNILIEAGSQTMKRLAIKRAGIVIFSFLLASCYQAMITLTPEGERILLFPHPEEFPQCLFVDDFRSMTLSGRENSYQQALNKIKNKVAVYQGTHLKINTSDTDELVTTITGEGYRCPLTEDGRIQEMKFVPGSAES